MKSAKTIAMSCALLFSLACVNPALATDYYVGRDRQGASDQNDGLSPVYSGGTSGPWRTLTQAATVAGAGDTVHVFAGDYRNDDMGWGAGNIALETSGEQAAPLRFLAAPDETVVVYAFQLVRVDWIEIEGFTFINRGLALPSNWVDMPEMVVDDPAVVIDHSEPWSTREARVRQKYSTFMGLMDYFNTESPTGIDVAGSSNIRIVGNSFSLYTFGVLLRNTATNVAVENNTFDHCRDGIFTWKDTPSTVGSVLRGNSFNQSFSVGIDVREGANGVLIEDNVSEYSAIRHIGLHSGARSTTIRGNVARHGGYYTETMEYPGSTAIDLNGAGPGNVIEGNLAAFQIDTTLLDGNGYILDHMDGETVTLRNNVAYRNMGSGIAMVHSPNAIIINNTLVENGFQTPDAHNGAGIRMSRDDDINNVISNNIFAGNKVSGIYSFHILEFQQLIDNNLYDQPGTALVWDGWVTDDRFYTSIGAVRAGVGGWEQSGVEGDAGFVDPAGGDFHLQPDSPAVDGGSSTVNVPDPEDSGSASDSLQLDQNRRD